MENENVTKFDKANVQAELLFCGCMYKEPDLYLSYGESTKSKYLLILPLSNSRAS